MAEARDESRGASLTVTSQRKVTVTPANNSESGLGTSAFSKEELALLPMQL